MSEIIAKDKNLFKRIESTQKIDSETVKKAYSEIEKRLGPRRKNPELDVQEIEQVANLVDGLLEKRRKANKMTTNQESRVAPAPTSKSRQQAYEQEPQPPHLKRSDTATSLQGIYTLPSSDPEQPHQPLDLTPSPQYLSGKLVSNLLAVIQILCILVFAVFIRYDENNVNAISRAYIESTKPTKRPNFDNNFYNPNNYNERPPPPPPPPPGYNEQEGYLGGPYAQPVQTPLDDTQNLHQFYYFFQDVHVMIFVGFGFLMTFLRKYGYSAVGYNLLIAAIAIQWSIICRGIFSHDEKGSIPIDITTLINGDFAAASVLITFGAVLGVTSPFQLVTICIIEVFLYALNEFIGVTLLKVVDVGGSIFIHTFGAYFGLSMSFVLRKNSECSSAHEGATSTSDLFSMVGTVFLWMFWPSFNGAMAEGDDQHRAVINTVLSLSASCIFTFAISGLVSPDNKFNMVHVQNATLAGGVAVGAVADLMIRPYGALIIGSLAGVLSTLGYAYVTPFLQSKINLHDTCGVNNLHGMPGIMAGLAGVVMALLASEDDYGISLYKQYPAMAPQLNTSALNELRKDLTSIEPGDGRTASQQALYQLLAMGVTLCIAVVGGSITGLLLRLPIFGQVNDSNLFDDSALWEIPEEEAPQHASKVENKP